MKLIFEYTEQIEIDLNKYDFPDEFLPRYFERWTDWDKGKFLEEALSDEIYDARRDGESVKDVWYQNIEVKNGG